MTPNIGEEALELLTSRTVVLKLGLEDTGHDVVAMLEDLTCSGNTNRRLSGCQQPYPRRIVGWELWRCMKRCRPICHYSLKSTIIAWGCLCILWRGWQWDQVLNGADS